MSEKGFFGKAFDDMKENAREQRKIDKENIAAIKEDNREMREALKNYKSDDMTEFKEADGIVEKAKVVASHISRDAKETAEENKENMKNVAEANRENYKKMLEEQRQSIKDITDKYSN